MCHQTSFRRVAVGRSSTRWRERLSVHCAFSVRRFVRAHRSCLGDVFWRLSCQMTADVQNLLNIVRAGPFDDVENAASLHIAMRQRRLPPNADIKLLADLVTLRCAMSVGHRPKHLLRTLASGFRRGVDAGVFEQVAEWLGPNTNRPIPMKRAWSTMLATPMPPWPTRAMQRSPLGRPNKLRPWVWTWTLSSCPGGPC